MGRKTRRVSDQRAKRDRYVKRNGRHAADSRTGTGVVIPQGKCHSCGKASFATEEIAAEALAHARAYKIATGNTDRIEKRYYECPGSGEWHLTSRATWVDRKDDAS